MLPAEQQRAIQPALGQRFSTALRCREGAGPRRPSFLLRVFVPSCLVCWIMSAPHTSAEAHTSACTRPHIAAASASTLAWLPRAWTCGELGDLPRAAAWAGRRQSPAYSFPEDCVAIATQVDTRIRNGPNRTQVHLRVQAQRLAWLAAHRRAWKELLRQVCRYPNSGIGNSWLAFPNVRQRVLPTSFEYCL
jgi:hypothetical protein